MDASTYTSIRFLAAYDLPWVNQEAALAHEFGVRFGYNPTTGALPMLDDIPESGVDVLIGCDPLASEI